MSVATGLQPIGESELTVALEEHLAPQLAALVTRHTDGHCMRCDDLDVELATNLCRRSASSTAAQVYVLGMPPDVADDVSASSTKVVVRNPDAEGRPCLALLVFVPPMARASARILRRRHL